jgi:hypothetical protein
MFPSTEPIVLHLRSPDQTFEIRCYPADRRLWVHTNPGDHKYWFMGHAPLIAMALRIQELEAENTRLVDQLMEASL